MFYLLYHPPSLILFFSVHVLYILGFFSLVNSAIRYYFLGSVTLVSPLPVLPPASPVILNIRFPCRSMKINTALILDERGGAVSVWRCAGSAGRAGAGRRRRAGVRAGRGNVAHGGRVGAAAGRRGWEQLPRQPALRQHGRGKRGSLSGAWRCCGGSSPPVLFSVCLLLPQLLL